MMKDKGLRFQSYNVVYWLIALAVILNFSGLFDTLMDVDATRYAAIAKTMVVRNNFLELFCDGKDWLDKPHFPFWVTALFFKVFGFSSWSYKLPGVLFMMLGAGYTYKLAKELYSKEVALFAVLMLLTAEHIILSNNDVRAEPFLTGLIIAGIYHFYRTCRSVSGIQLLLGAVFTACAIMTKGIFALVPIGGAIATELVIKREWKHLFHWKWLLAGLLIALFITPELYSLYYQFDLHPEKVVFGRTPVSGIRFFFWDSQFGRFLNTGPIKGEGDPFFFLHTLLWAFLPWSVLLYIALVGTVRQHYKHVAGQEWLCMGGSVLTFLLFSASRFQLPHYMNIVFPLFAIIAAQYMLGLQQGGTLKVVKVVQFIIITLFLIAPAGIQFVFQPDRLPFISVIIMAVLLFLIVSNVFRTTELKRRLVIKSVLASCFLNLYLNTCFYPSLLRYQSGSEAAYWINSHNTNNLPVAATKFTYSLEFYLRQPLYYTDSSGTAPFPAYLLYVPETASDALNLPGKNITVLQRLADYPITRMDLSFFYAGSRQASLKKFDIVLVQQK